MLPDAGMAAGPGHLGALVAVATTRRRDAEFDPVLLAEFTTLSRLTIEVRQEACGLARNRSEIENETT